MGSVRFGAPKELVLGLRDICKIKIFVETGTNRAETTVWASDQFSQVLTVEAYEPLYQQAVTTWGHRPNIRFIKGDSRTEVERICESLIEPAIFWLDAHWCGEFTFGKAGECPLVGELAALNSCKIPHIILIDDARLFLAPPPTPHDVTHWPGITEVCDLLSGRDCLRYVVVTEDVIVAVPVAFKSDLVKFLRSHNLGGGISSSMVQLSFRQHCRGFLPSLMRAIRRLKSRP